MSGDKVEGLGGRFVSEDKLDEQRRKRQEEWEKVRKPDDPQEAPEVEYDHRCLYDRLQEQKLKKDEEFQEQFKLKNQVRGLDEGETNFLDFVSERQQEIEKKRQLEDSEVLREYKESLVNNPPSTTATVKAAKKPAPALAPQSKKSQQALLAGAVKRRGSDQQSPDGAKKMKSSEIGDTQSESTAGRDSMPDTTEPNSSSLQSAQATDADSSRQKPSYQGAKVIGILPGMRAYADSDDGSSDESSSSDSDINIELHKTLPLVQQVQIVARK